MISTVCKNHDGSCLAIFKYGKIDIKDVITNSPEWFKLFHPYCTAKQGNFLFSKKLPHRVNNFLTASYIPIAPVPWFSNCGAQPPPPLFYLAQYYSSQSYYLVLFSLPEVYFLHFWSCTFYMSLNIAVPINSSIHRHVSLVMKKILQKSITIAYNSGDMPFRGCLLYTSPSPRD